jgi:hypothetical protein
MPLRRNPYKLSNRRYHSLPSGDMAARRINWAAVIGTALVFAALIVGIVLLTRSCGKDRQVSADASPSPTLLAASPNALATQDAQNTPPPQDGTSEARAYDLSQEATLIKSAERHINKPSIFGDELIYSAGSGSLLEPVFEKLYLFDMRTMTEQEITKVSVKDGELYEMCINTDYIVWLDTDQQGTNKLFYMRRNDTSVTDGEMPASIDDTLGDLTDITPGGADASANPASASPSSSNDPSASPSTSPSASPSANPSPTPDPEEIQGARELKQSGYHMPVLRLSGDRLIFNEQDDTKAEMLWLVELINEENVGLPGYTESLEGFEDIYAISAPDIHGNEVIWAAPDPADPDGAKSVIYTCDLDQLSMDVNYQPTYWEAGMYVHDPLTNGKAWAWIDTNHEPVSSLYVKYGDDVIKVAESTLDDVLTTYCLGDDMLVYAKGGQIWVYFYETGVYGRVTEEGETGHQPVAYGRRVVWFTDSDDDMDQLKVVYIP